MYTSTALVCAIGSSRLVLGSLRQPMTSARRRPPTNVLPQGGIGPSSESLSNEHWSLAEPRVMTSLINVRFRR